jgi:transcriptional regulator with XRE-family HTH domain
MVDVNRLRGKIIENGMTQTRLAEKIGMTKSTMSRRLSKGGVDFSIGEVCEISRVLHLSQEDAANIFFEL